MTRSMIAGGVMGAVLVLLVLAFNFRGPEQATQPAAPMAPAVPPSIPVPAETGQGFLYGRVETAKGETLQGRLRFGGDQEAFWGDYFNGWKDENPWAAQAPLERLPRELRPVRFLGFTYAHRESHVDLARNFMARLGDIARIEKRGGDVRVTLKSGTRFDLDWNAASDYDDGVRVWDEQRGVVDVDSLQIHTIDFLPTPALADAPSRLHGTVRTPHGDFTGFLQWDRQEGLGTDEMHGRTAEGKVSLRFDTIRSIARRPDDRGLVTLLDGREVLLSGTRGEDFFGTRELILASRGIYVDDARYGRVLVVWEALDRVELSPGASGPAYDDFAPGRPITGSVTTRDGSRLAGRLVYDLDESETTETLDAPSHGVNYTIPFGLIASIVVPGPESDSKHAKVILRDGEELQLERTGDFSEKNAGLLVFVDGGPRSEYVSWTDVARIDLRPTQPVVPVASR